MLALQSLAERHTISGRSELRKESIFRENFHQIVKRNLDL